MTEAKQKASKRLDYEILKMRQYIRLKRITHKYISEKSGVTQPNVWRFFSGKSKEPSVLTFLMITEAIGYEIKITKNEE